MSTTAGPSREFLTRMFPGLPSKGVGDFVEAGAFDRLSANCRSLPAFDALLSETASAAVERDADVNEILALLRSKRPDLVQDVVEQAVAIYFSCPSVTVSLTGVPSPLFPTNRVMDGIDFDLLAPVLDRCQGLRRD